MRLQKYIFYVKLLFKYILVLFTKNHIHFHKISSTNDFVLSLKETPLFIEGLLVTSDYQDNGRGQLSKKWLSKNGLNLLMSIVIEPNILIVNRFDITKIVSLAIYDFLISVGLEPAIKWPNDILINRRKIAGVLIQNIVFKDIISHSVIGIGFNINQLLFPDFPIPATSLINELGEIHDCKEIRNDLLVFLSNRLLMYRKGKLIDVDYNNALFLIGEKVVLEYQNKYIKCIIKNVDIDGCLQVSINNKNKRFNTNEVKFII